MTEDQLSFGIGSIAIVLSLFGIWKISELLCKLINLNLNFTFI